MADEAIKKLAVQLALEDGNFQDGVQSLKRQMQAVDSGFKASVAGLKNWGTNLDGLKANTTALSDKLNIQKQIVSQYEAQLKKAETALSENSQKMQDNKAKLEAAKSAYEESAASIGKNADATKKLKTELDVAQKAFDSSEKLVRNNNKSYEGYTIQLNNAKAALNKMSAELSESESKLKSNESVVSKLKSSFSQLADQSKKSSSSIKDHLGSLKSTIAGFATTLIAGLSIKSIVDATDSAEKTLAQMDAVLKSTGGTAGMTRQQLIDLASAQSKVTTYSKGTTEAAENMLLTFTNIKSNVFPQVLKATEDMATAMHTDATSAALTLGKALNDPAAGLTKLTKQGVTFTAAQKTQIQAMEKAGNVAGAQSIILAELTKEFGGSAKAAGGTFTGSIQIMQNNLKEAGVTIATALMPVVTNFMPSIVKGVQGLASEIMAHKGEIQGAVSSIGNVAKNIFEFVTSHGDLVKNVLIGIVGAIGAFKVATMAATVAQLALDAAEDANPIGLIVLAIEAAIVAIGALTAIVVSNWGKISAFFKSTWDSITKFFGDGWNSIKGVFSGVGDWFKNTFESAKNGIQSAWGNVSGFFSRVGGSIKKGFEESTKGSGTPLQNMVTNSLNIFKTMFSKLGAMIQSSPVGQWFANVFNSVKSAVQNAINFIVTPIKNAIEWIKIQWLMQETFADSALNKFKSAVLSIWNPIKNGFTQAWNGIKTAATGAWNLIKNAILGPILLLIDLVTGNFTKLKSDLTNLWTNIKNAASTIWNGLSQVFSGVWNAISGSAKAFWNVLSSGFVFLWNGITGTITTVWNNIHNFFVGIWNKIVTTFKPDMISNGFKSAWGAIQGAWNGATGWFSSVWNGIVSHFKPTMISDGFKNAWNGIKGAWSGAQAWFGNVWNQIKGHFKPDMISSGFKSAWGGIQSAWNGAAGWFGGIWNSIKGGFDKLNPFKWGADLINGIADGIKSAFKAVNDAVNWVADKIRAVLHFSRPDEGPLVDYETWMPDFMGGLAESITKSKYKVAQAIQGLSTDMSIGVKAQMQPAYAGAYSVPTYSNNNDVISRKLDMVIAAIQNKDTRVIWDGKEIGNSVSPIVGRNLDSNAKETSVKRGR